MFGTLGSLGLSMERGQDCQGASREVRGILYWKYFNILVTNTALILCTTQHQPEYLIYSVHVDTCYSSSWW